MEHIEELVKKFTRLHIGIVGDVMLDRFLSGSVYRISPEAPVPVVSIEREQNILGGAGNVAANITALGAHASLISIIGTDAAGRVFLTNARRAHIDCKGIIRHRQRTTTHKTRIVGGGQHIVRIDRESTDPIDSATEQHILRSIERTMPAWDAVMVSDYAKGLFTSTLSQGIVQLARRFKKIVVVDAKPKNIADLKGSSLFTPNTHEALAMAGVADIQKAGAILKRRLHADILITQGIDGMTLFSNSKKPLHISAHSHAVFDVVGAGDTVAAVCALAMGAGANQEQAARMANLAAGIVVSKAGTATVTSNELLRAAAFSTDGAL
jgi:rfaE bifunctional protein kinase chain/domain